MASSKLPDWRPVQANFNDVNSLLHTAAQQMDITPTFKNLTDQWIHQADEEQRAKEAEWKRNFDIDQANRAREEFDATFNFNKNKTKLELAKDLYNAQLQANTTLRAAEINANSRRLAAMIKAGANGANADHPLMKEYMKYYNVVSSGKIGVYDKEGKPVLDEKGNPVMQDASVDQIKQAQALLNPLSAELVSRGVAKPATVNFLNGIAQKTYENNYLKNTTSISNGAYEVAKAMTGSDKVNPTSNLVSSLQLPNLSSVNNPGAVNRLKQVADKGKDLGLPDFAIVSDMLNPDAPRSQLSHLYGKDMGSTIQYKGGQYGPLIGALTGAALGSKAGIYGAGVGAIVGGLGGWWGGNVAMDNAMPNMLVTERGRKALDKVAGVMSGRGKVTNEDWSDPYFREAWKWAEERRTEAEVSEHLSK